MAEIITNTEAAKSWLQSNPNRLSEFDQTYGAGSAKAILNGTYGGAEKPVAEVVVNPDANNPDGYVKDIAKGIAQGGVEAGNEFIQFFQEGVGAVADNITGAIDTFTENTIGGSKIYRADRDGDGKLDLIPKFGTRAEMAADHAKSNTTSKSFIDMVVDTEVNFEGLGKKRSTVLGGVGQSMSQFIIGLLGVGKFTKIKNGKIVGGMANGFVVDATMFDPYEDNFLKALKESDFNIDIPVITEALSNKETGDAWENRLKNALAGSIAGGTIDTVITVVRGIRLRKRAAMEAKAYGKVLNKTAEKLDASELELKEALEQFDEAKPDGNFSEDGLSFQATDGTVFDTSTGRVLEDAKVPIDVDQTAKLNLGFDTNNLPAFSGVKGATSDIPTSAQYKNITQASEIGGSRTAPKVIVDNTDEIEVKGTDEVVIPKPKVFDEVPKGGEPKNINTVPINSPSIKVDLKSLKENLKLRNRKDRPIAEVLDEVTMTIEKDNPISSFINPKSLKNTTGQIDDTDNIIAIANKVAEALDDGAVRASFGLDTLAKEKEVFEGGLKEFAKLTGKSIDDLKIAALKPFKNVKNANRELIKQKLIVRYALKEVDRLADEMNGLGDEIDSLLEKRLIAMMELATDAITYTKATTKEIARGLQAGNIKVGVELTEEAQKRLAKWGGRKRVKELAKQISDLKGNSVGKAKLLQKASKNKFWGVASEIWINSILSGFKTSALNITSNSYNLLLRPAIRATGGVLSGNGKIVEQSIREYVSIVSEVMDSIAYMTPMINSSGDSALKSAVRVIKSESGVLDKATKFDFDMDTNFKGSWKMNMLGHVVRAPSRFLKGQDEFAKQISFRSNLKATILTDARRMSQLDFENLGYKNKADFIAGEIDKATLSKEALAERWETMVAYGRVPDNPKVREAWINENIGLANTKSTYAAKALEEARETTFTTPLNDGLAKNASQIVQNYPFLRMFMPFVTTPMNILRTAFERTPVLGLMTRNNLKKFLHGTAEEKAMVRGNQAYGAAVSFMAFNYAMQGKITGGGPSYNKEPALAKLWNASPDWQPYSINTGTAENPNWVELKRLDPHGTLFGVIGDIYEMHEYSQQENVELTKLSKMVLASFANNVTSKTWMQGLNEITTLLTGDVSPREVDSILASRAAQFIPFSAMSMQLNQNINEQVREIRTYADHVRARIYQPIGERIGLGYDTLEVKHDWLTGEAVDSPDYMLGYIRAKKLDNGEIEAGKLYTELRKLNHPFQGPNRKIDGLIELDAKSYQRYNELVGTIKIGGKTLLQSLNETIDSAKYDKEGNNFPYDETRSQESHRVRLLNVKIQRYKKNAKRKLYMENPSLMDAVRTNKKVRRLQQIGRSDAADENLIFKFNSN